MAYKKVKTCLPICIHIYIYIYVCVCVCVCVSYGRRQRWGHLKESNHLQDLGVEWIFRKWGGEAWTGLVWLRIGAGDGRM